MRFQHILRLTLILWLAAAPLLSIAHSAEHGDRIAPEDTCLLCHIADRDDDGPAPDVLTIVAPPKGGFALLPAPQAGRTTHILSANSRAPPVSS